MDLNAVFSVQSVFYILSFRIQFIKDYVCIGFMAGSEGDNFVYFRHALNETDSVGTNSDICLGS